MTTAASGSPLDPRVERTRRRVLDAVVTVLAEEGLDAVTHGRVAEVSGVGRATLYRHWPDTPSLLFDTLRSRHDDVGGGADLADVPVREALVALVANAVRLFREDPLVPAMIALVERAEHDPAFAEVRRRTAATFGGALEAVVAGAQRRGELPTDLDLAHAKALLAGPIFFARFFLAEPLGEDRVEAHVDAWLRAVGHTPA